MKRFIAVALALVISFTAFGLNAGTAAEQTVITATVTETDASLSATVENVVSTFVSSSAENGAAAAKGEKLQSDTGSGLLNVIIDLFCFVKEGAIDPKISIVQADDDSFGRFYATYYDCLGREYTEPINAFINNATGEIYGEPYDSGVFGLGFNYDSTNKVFFAVNGCWQRNFGFMSAFDVAASVIGYDYITRSIYFDYAGKEWMVQIWKGNYHWEIFVGGETGIYNRPAGEGFADHYNCATDDEMIPMTMKVYDEGETYIDRASDSTWWMTGFKFAGHAAEKNELVLETSYTFPNADMCSAFVKAAQAMPELTCTSDGLTAYVVW